MGFKVSRLQHKTIPVKVPFLDEFLHINIAPAEYKRIMKSKELDEFGPIAYARREDEAANTAYDLAYAIALEAEKSEQEATQEARQAQRDAREAAEKYDNQDYDLGIATIVKSWDLVDDNDEPIDISLETVQPLWAELKQAIWAKVVEAMNPKNLMAQTRPTGSARKAR